MTVRTVLLSGLLAAAVATAGCSSKQSDPAKVATSSKAFSDAEAAFAAKNYGPALALYDEAIKGSSLQADLAAEAYARRGICKLETGDTAGAKKDFDKADEGGYAGDEFSAARKRLDDKAGR